MELSQRKELILSAIVEFYIATGQPVGSKFLVTALPFTVSSATIRNEMADLVQMGYLEQPHTSAGRIPSDKGLRYYTEKLLQTFSPSDSDMFRIVSSIDHFEGDVKIILREAAEILAELTGTLALITTPSSSQATIKNVQILPMGKRQALVIVSTSTGYVSRIAKLYTDAHYDLFELFYNVAAANFVGLRCEEIHRAQLQKLISSLGERALDISPLLVCLYEAVNESLNANVIVKGQSNLMNSALRGDAPQIIDLTAHEDEISGLMKNSGDGIGLKIGGENGYACLQNASLITCPYKSGTADAGTIAVIGPTKMDYSHILPLVKYISDVVGKLVTENTQNDTVKG